MMDSISLSFLQLFLLQPRNRSSTSSLAVREREKRKEKALQRLQTSGHLEIFNSVLISNDGQKVWALSVHSLACDPENRDREVEEELIAQGHKRECTLRFLSSLKELDGL